MKIFTQQYWICKWKSNKGAFIAIAMAIFLIVLPLKNGIGHNDDIPLIGGWITKLENTCNDEVQRNIVATGATYGSLKLIQKVPKMFEEAGVFGVKLGATLSPLVEQLDMLDSVMFYALLIAILQKVLLTWFIFVPFKFIIPLGLFLVGIGRLICERGQLEKIGKFFIQLGILFFLFIPTITLINHYIYDSTQIEKTNQDLKIVADNVEKDADKISQEQKDAQTPQTSHKEKSPQEQTRAQITQAPSGDEVFGIDGDIPQTPKVIQAPQAEQKEEEKGWFEQMKDWTKDKWNGVKETFKSSTQTIKDKIQALLKMIDDFLNKLMKTVAIFVLTTYIVPIAVFVTFKILLNGLFNSPGAQIIATHIPERLKRKEKSDEEMD